MCRYRHKFIVAKNMFVRFAGKCVLFSAMVLSFVYHFKKLFFTACFQVVNNIKDVVYVQF